MKTSSPVNIVFPTAGIASRRHAIHGNMQQVRQFRKETPSVRSEFARLLEAEM